MDRITQARRSLFGTLVVCAALFLSGCSYALPLSNLPSQPRLRVLAPSPDRYRVRVQAEPPTEHQVAPDGRVQVDVPRLPLSCDVYALGLKVKRGRHPLKTKVLQLVSGGKIRRKLSLDDLSNLPVDDDGYRLVTMNK